MTHPSSSSPPAELLFFVAVVVESESERRNVGRRPAELVTVTTHNSDERNGELGTLGRPPAAA
jgi:hypothetical protein